MQNKWGANCGGGGPSTFWNSAGGNDNKNGPGLNQRNLVTVIKQNPGIWDRNHPCFRDKEQKDQTWAKIGTAVGFPAEVCREAFKSLREKYIREREKSQLYGEYYAEWDLLQELKFLDPHILQRKASSQETDAVQIEEMRSNLRSDPQGDNIQDFDRALVELVRKTTPIWDRNNLAFPNKHVKNQMWQSIAQALNKDINSCMLRWKALREKYIRQKTRFLEGETKWELLDAMNFLDKVIQYRKKHDYGSSSSYEAQDSSYQRYFPQSADDAEYNISRHKNFDGDDNSYTDSSNDFLSIVKQENGAVLQVADSSFSIDSCTSRKRSPSINSEVSIEKKPRNEEVVSNMDKTNVEGASSSKTKTPEELFGDLVAAMLSKKPEKERNVYMIEIMTVLSK